MSELYDSIPPERRNEYLANANRQLSAGHRLLNDTLAEFVAGKVRKAENAERLRSGDPVADLVVRDMGKLVVEDAQALTKAAAEGGPGVAEGAQEYLANPDTVSGSVERSLIAQDIANRRARGEGSGKSFAQMYNEATAPAGYEPPKRIDVEFTERYEAAVGNQTPKSDPDLS